MSVTTLIETATQEFKQKLSACCEKLETERLTPELAEQVCAGLSQAISACLPQARRQVLPDFEPFWKGMRSIARP